MNVQIPERLASRKLWVALGTAAAIIFNVVDEQQIQDLLYIVVPYLLAQAGVDVTKEWRKKV